MKKTELVALIEQKVREILQKNKMNEASPLVGLTKKLDKVTSDYKNLLKQKQDAMDDMKKMLTTEKDPAKRAKKIEDHNKKMKDLNSKIKDMETKFDDAVVNMATPDVEDLGDI